MKKITSTLFAVCVCVLIFTAQTQPVHAATRTEMLQQIKILTQIVLHLQEQLAVRRGVQSSVSAISSLQYVKMRDYSGTQTNGQSVNFSYVSPSNCDPFNMDGVYTVDVGDGTIVKADCKGTFIHEYSNNGTYTARYKRDDVTLGQVTVMIDGKMPETPLYEIPDVSAEMKVESIDNRLILALGTITPPEGCTGYERMEVDLNFSSLNKVSYDLTNCKQISVNMANQYDEDVSTAFPELKLRWLDANNNTWTYKLLSRYKVDFSNPSDPEIIKLFSED